MRIKCVSLYLNEEQIEELDIQLHPREQSIYGSYLTIGKEYLVFGLQFQVDPNKHDTGPKVTITPDIGYVVSFPLGLFQITDPRVSRYWEARSLSVATIGFYPSSFYRESDRNYPPTWYGESYLNDLIEEGEPGTIEDFERGCALLESEFADHPYMGKDGDRD